MKLFLSLDSDLTVDSQLLKVALRHLIGVSVYLRTLSRLERFQASEILLQNEAELKHNSDNGTPSVVDGITSPE